MHVLDALVPPIRLSFDLWMQVHLGFFEQTEIVFSARTHICADDLKWSCSRILSLGQLGYNDLGFECMTFLFARIIALLSFFGRSTGDSVASIKTTSYAVSLSCRALRPGRAMRLSFTSVSSTH